MLINTDISVLQNFKIRMFAEEPSFTGIYTKLGRPTAETKMDKKTEYQDNVDRIEVEREFSLKTLLRTGQD